jgi:hypothetical protein
LKELNPEQLFFAYDKERDLAALRRVGKDLIEAGFRANRVLRCYCLCGYKNDTIDKAERRMREAWAAGFMPMAMLYRGKSGSEHGTEWRRFHKVWSRPAIMRSVMRDEKKAID